MQEQENKEEHGHDENELVAEPIPESGNSPESSDVDDSHKPADDGNPRQRRIGGTTRIPPKQRPSG
jgi:hypothetical protein